MDFFSCGMNRLGGDIDDTLVYACLCFLREYLDTSFPLHSLQKQGSLPSILLFFIKHVLHEAIPNTMFGKMISNLVDSTGAVIMIGYNDGTLGMVMA